MQWSWRKGVSSSVGAREWKMDHLFFVYMCDGRIQRFVAEF